jgi:N-hydroxyarylamine O-acetyltransferase
MTTLLSSVPDPSVLDMAAYLDRIEYAGTARADIDNLVALHRAHVAHVPFENFDVVLERPIRIDVQGVQEKLVRARRGGYCFEQNALFAAALEALGFRVHRWGARVRLGSSGVRPRTHMLLGVQADGEWWLADVGFGMEGLLQPMRLVEGEVVQAGWRFRLQREPDGSWVLQSLRSGAPVDLYAFTRDAQLGADYEMANFYTACHPESIFRRVVTVQRSQLPQRMALRNLELTRDDGSDQTVERIAPARLPAVLAELFGLALDPADTARLQACAEQNQLRKDFQAM